MTQDSLSKSPNPFAAVNVTKLSAKKTIRKVYPSLNLRKAQSRKIEPQLVYELDTDK